MKKLLVQIFPLISTLSSYSFALFSSDALSALTVTSVVVPQAIAYGFLTGLPPVYGLYTSIIPVIIYTLFGTSRHLSVGSSSSILYPSTFALISLLINASIDQILNSSIFEMTVDLRQQLIVPIALCLTFMVGLFKMFLSLFRIGSFVSTHLLPDCLVSGLTTASAFHIGTSQLKTFFGILIPNVSGVFGLFVTWKNVILSLVHTHLPTFFIGSLTFILILSIQYLNRLFDTCSKSNIESEETPLVSSASPIETFTDSISISFPSPSSQLSSPTQHSSTTTATKTRRRCFKLYLPEVILAVLISTIITFSYNSSSFAIQHGKVNVIGKVPTGLPSPTFPFLPSSLCPNPLPSHQSCPQIIQSILLLLLWPSFKIALVSSTLCFAVIQLYARKLKYSKVIDLDKELWALGIASLLGSVLAQSYVVSGSLSRTAVVVKSGAKSQVGAILTALFVLIVILTPVASGLSYIPLSGLAAVILVAVKGLLWQIGEGLELIRFCRTNDKLKLFHRTEAFVWWTVFSAVLLFDIDVGVIVGIIFCTFVYLWDHKVPRLQKMNVLLVGYDISMETSREPSSYVLGKDRSFDRLNVSRDKKMRVVTKVPSFGLEPPLRKFYSSDIPANSRSRDIPEDVYLEVQSSDESETEDGIEIVQLTGTKYLCKLWVLKALLKRFTAADGISTLICYLPETISNDATMKIIEQEFHSKTGKNLLLISQRNLIETLENLKRDEIILE